MAISYNGNRLIPTPFLSISKQYQTTGDGTLVGTLFNITLEGKLLYNQGSPTSSGTFWNGTGEFLRVSGYPPAETIDFSGWMPSIIRKQEAIRELFSSEGKNFFVEGYEGYCESGYLRCNPRIKNLSFPKGGVVSWANQADYKVELEADYIYLDESGTIEDTGIIRNYHIDTAEETWNIETDNPDFPLFRLTHQVSAKGKKFYSTSGTLDKQPWENARDYVLTKLGMNTARMIASGVLDNNGMSGYNYLRSQNIGELAGNFGVTETWLCYTVTSGSVPATEEFDVNVKEDLTGFVTASLQGKIQGLEERDYSTRALIKTKYQNAKAKYDSVVGAGNMLARANNFVAVGLNPQPLNFSAGFNQTTGLITYNYEYDNRKANTISGALSEIVTVSYNYPTDVFAEIPVLGRAAGPVLQSIQTRTSNKKTISVELMMPAITYSNSSSAKPETDALISGYVPGATYTFKSADTENWNPHKGSYNRQVSWTYSN